MHGTIQQVLIFKFAFGPEKFPGLSRNKPQNPSSFYINTGIQYLKSEIHSVESRVQDGPGFRYVG